MNTAKRTGSCKCNAMRAHTCEFDSAQFVPALFRCAFSQCRGYKYARNHQLKKYKCD